MTAGIYYVRFSAQPSQNLGEGLAVFKDNTVNGGDLGYLYKGSYSVVGSHLTARLHIKRWNPSMVSVFGSLPEFDLDLNGEVTPDLASFSAEGLMTQRQHLRITIRGQRLDDAA